MWPIRSSACGAERELRHTSPPPGKPRARRAVLPGIATPPLLAPAPAIRSAAYQLEIRPLRACDRERRAAAFERRSDRSRHDRFLGPKPRLSDAELDQLTDLDHISRDAVAAVERGSGEIVGVARYAVSDTSPAAADIAVVIVDDWQGRGLGLALTRLLVWRAATTGFTRLIANVLEDNTRSQSLLRKLGFALRGSDGDVLEYALDLAYSAARTASSSSTTSPSSLTAAIPS